MYVRTRVKEKILLICLYVDDLMVTGNDMSEIEEFKSKMKSESEMIDLGALSYFLGLEFKELKEGIIMHQKKYISEVLKKYNMSNCNFAATPVDTNAKLQKGEHENGVDATLFKSLVGSLRYICNSRPDISFGVGLVSRFMDDPRHSHWIAAKRILRYLKGTLEF